MRRVPVAFGVIAVTAAVALTPARSDHGRTGAAMAPAAAAPAGAGPMPAPAPAPGDAHGAAGPAAAHPAADAHPPRFPTTVAVATVAQIAVHDRPAGPVRTVLRSPAPFSGMPQIFTVVATSASAPGWLHVALRIRPNGATGWIRAADVALSSHSWWIDVNLTERWATVYHGATIVVATPVVIGTDASPTPIGDFFITEGVWTGSPGGPYGPYIFGLSAHSEVYTEFAGGDGQIGLHGTNQPALLGTSASHGCVRFPNEVIAGLAGTMPMGVPVRIHR